MEEILRFDGLEVPLNAESIKILLSEKRDQLNEKQARLDAAYQEIENMNAQISTLSDPKNLYERVNSRIRLINQCKDTVGDGERLDALSDDELKVLAIKKHYPDLDLKNKDQSYINGIFDSLTSKIERNDSLCETRKAIHNDTKGNAAYEKWLSYSANLWSLPLAGTLQGGR